MFKTSGLLVPTTIPSGDITDTSTLKLNMVPSRKDARFFWLMKPIKTPEISPSLYTGEKKPIMDSPLRREFCTSQIPVSPFMPLI